MEAPLLKRKVLGSSSESAEKEGGWDPQRGFRYNDSRPVVICDRKVKVHLSGAPKTGTQAGVLTIQRRNCRRPLLAETGWVGLVGNLPRLPLQTLGVVGSFVGSDL